MAIDITLHRKATAVFLKQLLYVEGTKNGDLAIHNCIWLKKRRDLDLQETIMFVKSVVPCAALAIVT